MAQDILVILNLGSTSAKFSAVRITDGTIIIQTEAGFSGQSSAAEFIANRFQDFVGASAEFSSNDVIAVGVRSAILQGLLPGVTEIDAQYLSALEDPTRIITTHAVNMAPPIAARVAQNLGVPCYTADPISSISPNYLRIVGITGLPGVEIPGVAHYLNVRYVIVQAAEKLGIPLETMNCAAVHAGGGISVSGVLHGDIIMTTNPNEANPWGERVGSMPGLQGFKKICDLLKEMSEKEVVQYLLKKCGFVGLTGAANFKEFLQMVRENGGTPLKASLVFEAMCFQMAFEILKCWMTVRSTVPNEAFHGLVVTGGMFNSPDLLQGITVGYQGKHLDGILHYLDVTIPSLQVLEYPGSYEDQALAFQIGRALRGEVEIHKYA